MDEVLILIRDCQNRLKKLNDWEKDFIRDIENQYRKRKSLTKAQKETLDNLWEKATS